MTKDFLLTKSSEFEVHKRLVQLISEEAEILDKTNNKKEIKRHEEILEFLIELQCISVRGLKNESNRP